MDMLPLLPLSDQARILAARSNQVSLITESIKKIYQVTSMPEPELFSISEAIATIRFFNLNQQQPLDSPHSAPYFQSQEIQEISAFLTSLATENKVLKIEIQRLQNQKQQIQKELIAVNSVRMPSSTPKTVPLLSSFVLESLQMARICEELERKAEVEVLRSMFKSFECLFRQFFRHGKDLNYEGVREAVDAFRLRSGAQPRL
ncbi:hypothetical protein SS50377_24799 [Spironucleus salmonicida]|uniref:Uncharacterized protein n=1 Tax=Spironucleus salmonicida TaxID=348837 RepID=V6LV62_9EUKA|nr:hypothetical protein SS50377_24781 [Spironucleus salmonicida]KAH0572687.1 hypothetical protein SS50377_24799 [Spironucleus salmonicida]|eukprot:EST44660.1 Hypothetical protein SS50377_15670 [Spironucleus salmonicida]